MTPTSTFNSWVTYPKPNPDANLRLLCFPYAGGSSLIFRKWSDSLPSTVEVCPVELPGRGSQIKLPLFTRLVPLVEALAQALKPHLDKPFAFFGHSMGALVSFELARLLRKEYGFEPVHLFVSGRRAPQLSDPKPPIHTLGDSEFKEELRQLNGTPKAVLENAELMEILVPIVRADFATLETYVYTQEPPLDSPIAVFGGLEDLEANYEELEAWREQTSSSFSLQMFPGDHFFINSAQSLLLDSLAKRILNLKF
ncbi:thioesterase II family protein [Scytonema sp. NUACC26]|uniref:thioesterase II family protein n=1 Tax=Scytonema sp. NUACC26 TaxID=3140176 RepID=UPI0034DC1C48